MLSLVGGGKQMFCPYAMMRDHQCANIAEGPYIGSDGLFHCDPEGCLHIAQLNFYNSLCVRLEEVSEKLEQILSKVDSSAGDITKSLESIDQNTFRI